MIGVTDDIVEVHRMVGGQDRLVAVYLSERHSDSQGITNEHWILRNGDLWPTPLYAADWLVAKKPGTADKTVAEMCAMYYAALGYGSLSMAQVHRTKFTPGYMGYQYCR